MRITDTRLRFAPSWRVASLLMGVAQIVGLSPGSAQTWSIRPSGTAAGLEDVTYVDASTAVAVGTTGDITRSIDEGSSWAVVHTAGQDLHAVFSSGATVLAVGNATGGGNERIARSIDSGATWANIGGCCIPASNTSLQDGLFLSSSIAIAAGITGQRILRSTDGGANWSDVHNAGQDLFAVASSGATVLAVGNATGGGDETIARSIDSGATWANIAPANVPSTNSSLRDVRFVNATTAVGVGTAGEILRSTDGGATWANPFTDPQGDNLLAIASSGSTVIAVGANGSIARSNDAGVSWSSPASGTASQLNDVHFLTSSLILVAGNGGTILSSSDAGVAWGTQTTGTVENLEALASNNVLAVGANGTILLSTDQLLQLATQPIPFRHKWTLVAILLGVSLWSLRRRAVR